MVSRETQHMGVPYYVDKSFEKEYRGAALEELEKTIESDYIEHLQSSCWKEKQQSKQIAELSHFSFKTLLLYLLCFLPRSSLNDTFF